MIHLVFNRVVLNTLCACILLTVAAAAGLGMADTSVQRLPYLVHSLQCFWGGALTLGIHYSFTIIHIQGAHPQCQASRSPPWAFFLGIERCNPLGDGIQIEYYRGVVGSWNRLCHCRGTHPLDLREDSMLVRWAVVSGKPPIRRVSAISLITTPQAREYSLPDQWS